MLNILLTCLFIIIPKCSQITITQNQFSIYPYYKNLFHPQGHCYFQDQSYLLIKNQSSFLITSNKPFTATLISHSYSILITAFGKSHQQQQKHKCQLTIKLSCVSIPIQTIKRKLQIAIKYQADSKQIIQLQSELFCGDQRQVSFIRAIIQTFYIICFVFTFSFINAYAIRNFSVLYRSSFVTLYLTLLFLPFNSGYHTLSMIAIAFAMGFLTQKQPKNAGNQTTFRTNTSSLFYLICFFLFLSIVLILIFNQSLSYLSSYILLLQTIFLTLRLIRITRLRNVLIYYLCIILISSLAKNIQHPLTLQLSSYFTNDCKYIDMLFMIAQYPLCNYFRRKSRLDWVFKFSIIYVSSQNLSFSSWGCVIIYLLWFIKCLISQGIIKAIRYHK